jgi:starch synthase
MSLSTILPLRVLIFSLEYGPKLSGGVGTHVAELSAWLARDGCRVTIVAYTRDESSVFEDGGVEVHLVAASRSSSTNAAHRSMAEGILSINRDLISYSRQLFAGGARLPDVIHYHNWISFPAARQCATDFALPLVGTVHFLSEPIERWWGQTPDPEMVRQEAAQLQVPHTIITVSESMRQIIQSAHAVAGDRLHVIHNGMDAASFMTPRLSAGARKALRQTVASEGERILIYAGRLNPMKGVVPLLLSAARVTEQRQDVKYLLVGESDSRDYAQVIESVFRRHPELRSRVSIIGRVPRQQLALLYQVADIALVPSVYEPCAYSAIEAMSAGLPVIASNAGGLGEIVLHEKTGLLVAMRRHEAGTHEVDTDELCAAQLALLANPRLATEYGLAGYERVLREYNSEKMARSTLQVYRRAAGQNDETLRAARLVES